MKYCSKCKIEKPVSEFWKAKHTKDGLQGWCKTCSKARVKEHLEAHPERASVYNRRARLGRYGLSETEYEDLLRAQGGVCKICGAPPGTRKLAVDHCHDTGVIRGILCHTCNVGLGMFHNDIEKLRSAIAYLE